MGIGFILGVLFLFGLPCVFVDSLFGFEAVEDDSFFLVEMIHSFKFFFIFYLIQIFLGVGSNLLPISSPYQILNQHPVVSKHFVAY
jgi:hypothetical protein